MLTQWLPTDCENKLPPNASHQVSCLATAGTTPAVLPACTRMPLVLPCLPADRPGS